MSLYKCLDTWSMVVCHEFFDALPIYKFERANDGWREIQVDIDNSEDKYVSSIRNQIIKD